MSLFSLKNNQVIIDPEVLFIPQLKEIWDSDKSKDKATAYKELAVIYYFTDYKSPYMVHAEDLRMKTIIEDFVKDPKWRPDERIVAAIAKYKTFQYTPAIRLLDGAHQACDKLTKYFLDVDLNKTNKMGQLIHKSTDLSKNLKEVGAIVSSLNVIKEQIKKEVMTKRVKGTDSQISSFEE